MREMMNKKRDDLFIEVESFHMKKSGHRVCGDVFFSKKIKGENRTVAVLSDGLGSGIKANVLATMTASMALNFTTANKPVKDTAEIVMRTLPLDSVRKISYSTFTIVDMNPQGGIQVIEYGNPNIFLFRGNKPQKLQKEKIAFEGNTLPDQELYASYYDTQIEDRLIVLSDGISQSGMGTDSMPFGWDESMINQYIEKMLTENPGMSADEIARKLVHKAVQNDQMKPKDDVSCGVLYFRQPRKMLICSGPPFDMEKDRYLAEQVAQFEGKKIIAGGTTAQILSRELDKEVNVDINSGQDGIPPYSHMKEIGMVTEGILTVGRVAKILENIREPEEAEDNAAGKIVQEVLYHDEISFIVGTRVNEAHQDPKLPVDLEIRRNIIKKIVNLLEEKFLKKVNIEFI